MIDDWSVLKVIQWTSQKFKDVGIPSFRLDSELLIAHALDKRRIDLYINYNQPLDKEELASIRKLIQMRLKRIPVSHIIGKREFMSLSFKVARNVFIPRPDTEILVEFLIDNIDQLLGNKTTISAVDMCTGTGCIGISLMHYIKSIQHIEFLEKDPEAISCLTENCKRHLKDRDYKIRECDVLQSDLNLDQYDLITCNPPYIPDAEIEELEPEVRLYHSRLSLSGSEDGLEYYRKLSPVLFNALNDTGVLVMEIGIGQHDDVSNFFKTAGFTGIKTLKDLNGVERHVIGKKN